MPMEGYTCKIATRSELCSRWDYLNAIHPGSREWMGYRGFALRNFDDGAAITYLGFLNGEIICEATAYIKSSAFVDDIDDPSGLLTDSMGYLAAFRTNEEYEGQGYFRTLYEYAEADMRARGYTALCLGVGPESVRNIQIYFHLGYTDYLKTEIQKTPDGQEDVILFYKKKL